MDSNSVTPGVVGLEVLVFLERRETEKQNVREHSSIDLTSLSGMRVFADINGTGAG